MSLNIGDKITIIHQDGTKHPITIAGYNAYFMHGTDVNGQTVSFVIHAVKEIEMGWNNEQA